MIVVELIIVLLAIFLGARLGGIGIGFAGGLGVLVLAAIGVKPGTIPFDVISIIMAVIAAISAMQVAGGLDYLVNQTEKLLRKNPKYITILAPIVTYFLTIFAGTGNISLATLPVIAEVAKEQESNLAARSRPPWYPRRLRLPPRRFLRPWCICLLLWKVMALATSTCCPWLSPLRCWRCW